MQKIKSTYGFCFGIEVVKNSEWACVFCIAVILGGGAKFASRISTVQNTEAPLRVFDNFDSKAKTIEVARFLPSLQ